MKNILLVFYCFSICLFACKSSKELGTEKGVDYKEGNLKINEVYIQEEIPGDQERTAKKFLTLDVKGQSLENIQLDRIVLKANGYRIDPKAEIQPKNNKIKLALQVQSLPRFIDDEPTIKVIIYYTQVDKIYRQTISSIFIKEPLYLP